MTAMTSQVHPRALARYAAAGVAMTLAACANDGQGNDALDAGAMLDGFVALDSRAPVPDGSLRDAGDRTDAATATDGAMRDAADALCTDTPAGVEITELARSAASGPALGVIAYRVTYSSTDGTRVQGQICVPQAAGPHPIVVYVRGGVEGLGVGEWGPIPGNLCHGTASGGAIFVAPQLRGSRDRGTNALLGLIDFQSSGVVEFCAGEVDDTIALMEIAQRRCDADPDRVAMWGPSHGGCTTLMAASRRPAGLRAAAALVAPVDLVTGYEHNAVRAPGGNTAPAAGCDAVADHQYISAGFAQIFGTPATNPTGYTMRSAIHQASTLATFPLLLIYGVEDCLIPVVGQACAMHDALTNAGAAVSAFHLDSSGQTTTAPIPGCESVVFQAQWPASNDFSADHYLILGDGQGHQLGGGPYSRELDAIRAFFLHHAF